MMFLNLAYLRTNKICFIKDSLYYYMVRQDSIISTIKKEQIESTQNAMVDVKNIYEEKNKELLELLNAMAFLHFGISLTFRLSYDKKNFKETYKTVKNYLNKEFPNWKKCKYLNIWYNLTHKSSNLKIAIMKKVYKLGLYKSFLVLYRFMIDKLKIDIKW